MTRTDGWETRLQAYLTAKAHEPFIWGVNDCCLFVAGAIEAQTGVDVADGYRGHYFTQDAAAAVTGCDGARDIESFVADVLGRAGTREINPYYAQRGDVCLSRYIGTTMLGVLDFGGQHALCVAGREGYARVSLNHVTRAWTC